MSDTEKLLPCPFCKGKAEHKRIEVNRMNQQDLKECIAEVKNSDIPNPSKKKIMNILYERMYKDGWIPCSCNIPG